MGIRKIALGSILALTPAVAHAQQPIRIIRGGVESTAWFDTRGEYHEELNEGVAERLMFQKQLRLMEARINQLEADANLRNARAGATFYPVARDSSGYFRPYGNTGLNFGGTFGGGQE